MNYSRQFCSQEPVLPANNPAAPDVWWAPAKNYPIRGAWGVPNAPNCPLFGSDVTGRAE